MSETAVSKPRLLILDDEEAIAYPIARYFGARGWHAEIATEAEEGEALIEHRAYDLFILDLRLTSYGGAEGLDVLRRIRSQNTQTPVIILSANTSDDVTAAARAAGADRVLGKPQPLNFLMELAGALVGQPVG